MTTESDSKIAEKLQQQLSENIKSTDYPTPKQIRNILKPQTSGVAVKWYDLGIQLLDDGVGPGVLDLIKADHHNDNNTCCNEMFVTWLQMEPNATWSQLVSTLTKIGMNSVAEDLKKQLKFDEDMLLPTNEATKGSSKAISSSCFTTPDQASSEFSILLANIIKELKKNENDYLETIKSMCSFLTVKDDPNAFLFNEEQQDAINACDNLTTLFTKNLRGCWRWDDFSFLKKIIQSIESCGHCELMLSQYEQKLYSQMKLQQIYDHCIQENQDVPEGYDIMVAIVHDKIFSRITKEEYDQLKEFIAQHCGVKSYVIPPFHKAAKSSLVLEFIIPVTAVSHMVETATRNSALFLENGFVYLRIAMTMIFDKRNNGRRHLQLYTAAGFGYVGVVKKLILTKYVNVNISNKDQHTPLHTAANRGHAEVVELLIRLGADVSAVEKNQSSPLHIAASYGHVEVVELLIRLGADVSAVDKNQHTPLHIAAFNGRIEVVELLIRLGANVSAVGKNQWTPLHIATANDGVEVVELLIRLGADISAADKDMNTPLHLAVKKGHLTVIETLIKSGARVNSIGKDKYTPLHLAVHNGHLAVVETLIRLGAYVNSTGQNDWTPLHIAAQTGQSMIVETLIRLGAIVNALDKNMLAPLHIATLNGHVAVLEILVRLGIDVNTTVKNNESTSIHLAAQTGHILVLEKLIELGANVNAVNNSGQTPLFIAVQNGHVRQVELLIKSGANVNVTDKSSSTLLHVAVQYGHTQIADILLKHGIYVNSINKIQWTPLHFAAQNGSTQLVELLIRSHADVNAINMKGETALHLVSQEGLLEVVKMLTSANADLNIVNKANRTPLLEAVWHRRKSVIHYFVEEVKVDTTNMTKYIKQWMERQLEEYKNEPRSPGKSIPDYESDPDAHSDKSSGHESGASDEE
ncbi:CARD- and ANK-domain containing inflammasome adapter protein-like isoform X2 [Dysidea avara]|uniref:CARD- and ANK-domain containing inflammasome adapter protein-like isoform X2 n=1 Tax=Dysidea avara TaxID=196820 RepID=UPI003318A9C7